MRLLLVIIAIGVTTVGQQVNAEVDYKLSPLHQAAYRNDTISLKRWLSRDLDVNHPGKHGVTPLHTAAFEGHKESLEMLLEHDADPNITDDFDRTPLDLALEHGHLAIAGILIPITEK